MILATAKPPAHRARNGASRLLWPVSLRLLCASLSCILCAAQTNWNEALSRSLYLPLASAKFQPANQFQGAELECCKFGMVAQLIPFRRAAAAARRGRGGNALTFGRRWSRASSWSSLNTSEMEQAKSGFHFPSAKREISCSAPKPPTLANCICLTTLPNGASSPLQRAEPSRAEPS